MSSSKRNGSIPRGREHGAAGDVRGEVYDRAYYDKWYRHPRHRVRTRAELARIVRFVFSAAEHILERPVRSVLDVGAGEGNWYPLLTALRPGLRYRGVDPSEYAVARFGARRNLVQGSVTDLAAAGVRGPYDLVIASGMLNYLGASDLRTGLAEIARHVGGVAYLELFSSQDAFTGDTDEMPLRPARWYARELAQAGFVSCGLHLYVPKRDAGRLARLEVLAR
ncbi:MAG: class I SAM-dependent methyltransferase [Gemmatimonadaceae bacterium]|nr:class I SAM-dependent methyltransferase [Gemmatimonadaceae bacterium]